MVIQSVVSPVSASSSPGLVSSSTGVPQSHWAYNVVLAVSVMVSVSRKLLPVPSVLVFQPSNSHSPFTRSPCGAARVTTGESVVDD